MPPTSPAPRRGTPLRGLAAASALALPLAALAVYPAAPGSAAPADPDPATSVSGDPFARTATYPVFQNLPDDVDPSEETVAEISAVSEDGERLVYTDAPGKRIGFLDISDPDAPEGLGTLSLAELGDAEDEPTSVAVVGDFVLVVVNTSESFTDPSGRLDVVDLDTREQVTSIDLGGQPDSIAISPSGQYGAIAIENERDEEAEPDGGGEEGELPQAPAGFVQVLDLESGDPTDWTAEPVELDEATLDAAGLYAPSDPEPEYVSINADDQLVVTLQENNGLAFVDLPTGEVTDVHSAGEATVPDVDTTDDQVFNPVDTVTAPREPDSVAWVGDGLVATANEGDLFGGTRGWTVFDAGDGSVVWDAGNSVERIATRYGYFNDGRADNKGPEPEGLAFAEIDGTPYAFVGTERDNVVLVYDMSDPTEPVFVQLLPTTNGPEGILPIPGRDLLAVSSETDDAAALVRASVTLFSAAETPGFVPDVASDDTADPAGPEGQPIGWGALGALSAEPSDPDLLWTASDSAYRPGRLYAMDVTQSPALITDVVETTEDGEPADLDVEGLAALEGGGFWLASEGATGPENELVRTDADGAIEERVALPTEVSDHVRQWGLEGVAVEPSSPAGDGDLFVVLQRPLWEDPAASPLVPLEGDDARIGRYDTQTGDWSWYLYPLESTGVEGDWVGLSEVTAVDDDTLAVIERDKQNGATAAVKRVYAVDLPDDGTPTGEEPEVLDKRLAVDVLPEMQARNGWVQEKLEGLTIGGDGGLYAVTDNDGLDDATGETQLFDLGEADQVFGEEAAQTRTTLTAKPRKVRPGDDVRVTVRVRGADDGRVRLTDRGRRAAVLVLDDGRARARVSLRGVGRHPLRAFFLGTDEAEPSASRKVVVRVRR